MCYVCYKEQARQRIWMILKFKTLNVRGLQSRKKREEIFGYLRQCRSDMYVLQETHSTISDERLWSTEWGSAIFYDHGTSRSCGIAILFGKNRKLQIHDITYSGSGRSDVADVEINEYRFTLGVVYAPNVDDAVYFTNLFQALDSYSNP